MADLLLTHGYFLAEDEKERQIMKPYPPLGLLSLSARARMAVHVRGIRQHHAMRSSGWLAGQLAQMLKERRASRERLLALSQEALTTGNPELIERVGLLIRKEDQNIRKITLHILRLEEPELYRSTIRVERAIGTCMLAMQNRERRPRHGSRQGSRRTRTARRARAPARSTDDLPLEPFEPPARRIFAHAARFTGDARVAWWLQRWGEEALEREMGVE